jgi:hypothetical protein
MNIEICLEAVKKDGLTLQYVPENIMNKNICLKAVRENRYALNFIPKNIKDYDFCLKAVKKDGLTLQYVHTICGKTKFFHKVNLDSFNVNLWLTLTECSRKF